ncbi:hypothetical protein HON59_02890, partial [bacterium]|nr:hypothetical protein [bacterium]
MVIVICFSTAVETTSAAWYRIFKPFDESFILSPQGIWRAINPTNSILIPEQTSDGKTEAERDIEKQRQIQNERREARSEFTALNPIKGVTDAEAAES